jgi:tetratricopeptide (TPR) repeat protein
MHPRRLLPIAVLLFVVAGSMPRAFASSQDELDDAFLSTLGVLPGEGAEIAGAIRAGNWNAVLAKGHKLLRTEGSGAAPLWGSVNRRFSRCTGHLVNALAYVKSSQPRLAHTSVGSASEALMAAEESEREATDRRNQEFSGPALQLMRLFGEVYHALDMEDDAREAFRCITRSDADKRMRAMAHRRIAIISRAKQEYRVALEELKISNDLDFDEDTARLLEEIRAEMNGGETNRIEPPTFNRSGDRLAEHGGIPVGQSPGASNTILNPYPPISRQSTTLDTVLQFSSYTNPSDNPSLRVPRDAFKNAEYAEALELVDLPLKLKTLSSDASLHEFRALCLFALKRYDESASELSAVLSAGPGWDWPTLISLYGTPGTYTQQLRVLETYCSEHPQSTECRFVLAYHYLTAGHVGAAIRQLQNVSALQPENQLPAQLIRRIQQTGVPSSGGSGHGIGATNWRGSRTGGISSGTSGPGSTDWRGSYKNSGVSTAWRGSYRNSGSGSGYGLDSASGSTKPVARMPASTGAPGHDQLNERGASPLVMMPNGRWLIKVE